MGVLTERPHSWVTVTEACRVFKRPCCRHQLREKFRSIASHGATSACLAKTRGESEEGGGGCGEPEFEAAAIRKMLCCLLLSLSLDETTRYSDTLSYLYN